MTVSTSTTRQSPSTINHVPEMTIRNTIAPTTTTSTESENSSATLQVLLSLSMILVIFY